MKQHLEQGLLGHESHKRVDLWAAGFIGVSFKKFAATILLAGAIWTPALFGLAYWFGNELENQIGAFRWIAPL